MNQFAKNTLTRLAPILGAGAIGACPLCWVGSASLLTFFGLGALVPLWPWVVGAFLALGVVGFAFDYRSHRDWRPLALLAVGGALLYVGRYVFVAPGFGYWQIWGPGAALVLYAVFANKRLFRKPSDDATASPGGHGSGNSLTPRIVAALAVLFGLAVGFAWASASAQSRASSAPTAISAEHPYAQTPVINAYYNGESVWFMHTDVSDEQMAKRLTKMTGFNTIFSPQLRAIPPSVAGAIYVFTNGISQAGAKPWGGGPFGYQIDIMSAIPGDSAYTPILNPHLVTWKDAATPRVLTSVDELTQAQRNGELTITETPVIVNAPVIKWPSPYLNGQSKVGN